MLFMLAIYLFFCEEFNPDIERNCREIIGKQGNRFNNQGEADSTDN